MEILNSLEQEVLQSIIEENKEKYPFLLAHLPLLNIKNREYTGVGVYSNFEYSEAPKETLNLNALLSSNKTLIIPGLQNEVSYVLDITDGKINYLELVTNGNEDWNGNMNEFSFS